MKSVWLIALALLPVGCQKSEKEPAPAPAASVPEVALSGQPWRGAAPAGSVAVSPAAGSAQPTTWAREQEAGRRMGSEAGRSCSDKPCLLGKCSQGCGAYMRENESSFKTAHQRNDAYFVCIGACMGAGKDAGVKIPDQP